jgi:phosphate transport system ATP-binding protein
MSTTLRDPKPQEPAVVPVEASAATPAPAERGTPVRIEHLDAWYGQHHAISGVTLDMPAATITAIIGPSGCGKSTLVRCLNRMHEVTPGAHARGGVFIGDTDIYSPYADPVAVRSMVGMVFQKPNPFPMMSVFDNVAAGPRLRGWKLSRRDTDDLVERNLRRAALWDEVKDKLHRSGGALSGGQQQRLCIARALATDPSVLLMDEPCSALDPIATYKIEELLRELSHGITIVIVTHNMQQASRVSELTAFMLAGDDGIGRLVEFGRTEKVFTNPVDKRTEAYITGRFG